MSFKLFIGRNFINIIFVIILVSCYLFWNKEKKRFNYIGKLNSKYIDIVFSIFASLLVSMYFYLCPIKEGVPGIDSSVFLYIGKMMHKGLIPYKELFDHKGPLLFFIQYMGFAITSNGFIGVWILELINMLITTYFLVRLARLFSKDTVVCYLSVIFTIVICGANFYEGGNLTEEYALGCISVSMYIIFKYLKHKVYRWYEVILLGVSMMVVILLRVNMISLWLVFIPIIIIGLIYEKKYRVLWMSIGCFIVGILIVAIPVMSYLLYTDSLNNLILDYLVFNFAYCKDNGIILKQLSVICYFIKLMYPAILAFIIAFVSNKKNKFMFYNFIFFVVSLIFSTMSGNKYAHYAMVLLPSLIIPFVYAIPHLYNLISKINRIEFKKSYCIKQSGLLIVCFIVVILQVRLCIGTTNMDLTGDPIVRYLKKNTSRNQDVLIMGNLARYYLINDVSTENRFFYQTPPINISDSLYKEFVEELKEKKSDYIIIKGNFKENIKLDTNMGKIFRYLEQQYENKIYSKEVFQEFYVYTLNE